MKKRRKILRYVMIILTVALTLSTVSCAPFDIPREDKTTPIDNESNTINDKVTTSEAEQTTLSEERETPDNGSSIHEERTAGPDVVLPAEPSTHYETSTSIIDSVKMFFSSSHKKTECLYILIDNYIDLCELYEASKIEPSYSGIHFIQGNVHHSEKDKIYTEEYFKSDYIIAIIKTESSGSYEHSFSVKKQVGSIKLVVTCDCPPVQSADIGGFINLVPIQGKYQNEQIEIELVYPSIVSYP